MTPDETTAFAHDWVAAWNSHDLERIMSHYSEDVELTSPLVSRILGEGQHTVRGKVALRAYFKRGLEAFPDLEFVLWGVYPGVNSVVLHYQSVREMKSAEVMVFDGAGKVCRVRAHYAPASKD